MRVLVAEDHPRVIALLRRGLAEERYSVDVATDGVDAVWLCRCRRARTPRKWCWR